MLPNMLPSVARDATQLGNLKGYKNSMNPADVTNQVTLYCLRCYPPLPSNSIKLGREGSHGESIQHIFFPKKAKKIQIPC